MKKTVKALGITAALAVMIPLSAYAATTTGSSATEKIESASTWSAAGAKHEIRGDFGLRGGMVGQEVLDLLKLDKAAFNEKIKAGSTLAQIAEEQGVSRDSLKGALTDAFNKKQAEQKQLFTTNLDKVIDSNLQINKLDRRGGGFFITRDLTEMAKLLGISADEVKEQLKAGKSLADLAKEKGIDVQTLIDAQKAAFTASINQAVKDGKLTQEQADKQLADVATIAEKIVNGEGFGAAGIGHGMDRGRHHKGGADQGLGGVKPSDRTTTETPAAS